MNAEETGKKITELRKTKNLTQKQLATQLYVTDKAVSKWERGINFPDLGLIEVLAEALETTPAYLLGIENEEQKELICSLTEITSSQTQELQKEIRQSGWLNLVLAIFLEILLYFVNIHPQGMRSQSEFQILLISIHAIIGSIGMYGFYILKKYKEIKSWELLDYMLVIVLFFVVLFYLGFQFLTGYSPNDICSCILLGIGSISIQLLFYRIMRPYIVKAIPLLLGIFLTYKSAKYIHSTYFIYSILENHTRISGMLANNLFPTIFMFITWLICKKKKVWK